MNDTDQALVTALAQKHGVSAGGVQALLDALQRGNGTMAQLNHPDWGGMAQWSPGMSMVGDMFNTGMKARFEAVAAELAQHLRDNPGSGERASPAAGEPEVSYRSGAASPGGWWPADLGQPSSAGSQNAMRYAVFNDKARLVIDDGGTQSIYDTGAHQIGGVAQAQGTFSSLTFTSQDGLVRVSELRRIR